MFLAYEEAMWLVTRRVLRPARELYGLRALRYTPALRRAVARGETLLLAYSEALLPRSGEWPANAIVTGWWFLDDGARWSPPSELERFLAEGPTPIYVGFGSMAFRDRDALLDVVLSAVARVGARCRARLRLGRPRARQSTPLRLRGRRGSARLAFSAHGRNRPSRRGWYHGRSY